MNELRKNQRFMMGHGALLLLVGGLVGFGFLFHLVGEIRVLLPWAIDYQVPGSYKAWRMTHLEAIMNGLGLWLFAATLPILEFSPTTNRRLSIGVVIASWTFVIASFFDCIFPDSRGIKIVSTTNLTNDIAAWLFVVGIVIYVTVWIKIARACLRTSD